MLTSVNDPDKHIRIVYVGRPDVLWQSSGCYVCERRVPLLERVWIGEARHVYSWENQDEANPDENVCHVSLGDVCHVWEGSLQGPYVHTLKSSPIWTVDCSQATHMSNYLCLNPKVDVVVSVSHFQAQAWPDPILESWNFLTMEHAIYTFWLRILKWWTVSLVFNFILGQNCWRSATVNHRYFPCKGHSEQTFNQLFDFFLYVYSFIFWFLTLTSGFQTLKYYEKFSKVEFL